jgi:hypothetical protein
MKTLAKGFVIASVILFSASLTGAGSEFLWGFLKPLSALFFGAFFITNLPAKEYAIYDKEHEYRMALARETDPQRARTFDSVAARSGHTTYETQTHRA